ncbi:hypothetical protein GEV33_007053 [Tenebrio molitor]|uniref:Uncharacterized protein n=1 Tax=Tenebrio molitor TaxID=7067 RepID=A0A8J6LDD5_TENMO|nr:hypothetical protein GEV33_007053 [Tenebrio molitor]
MVHIPLVDVRKVLYSVRRLQECPLILERISLRVSGWGSRVKSVFYIGQRHAHIGLKPPVIRMLRNYEMPTCIFFVAAYRKSKNASNLLVNQGDPIQTSAR